MVDYIDNQVALHEVCKHYSLPADSSVRDFLMEHGSIAPVLLCAVPQVKRYFGANSDVRLKAPIDEAGEQMLYAVIMWSGRVEDVRLKLNEFDDGWWLAQLAAVAGELTFTYELV